MNQSEARIKLSQLIRPEVLDDVTKLFILKLLSAKETCEYEIMSMLPWEFAHEDVSQHLNMLEKEGIVKKREEGLRTFYSLTNPEVGKLLADL